MKKKNVVWMACIATICAFLLFGKCGLATGSVAVAANLPEFFTVSTGNVAVKMRIASRVFGDDEFVDLWENMQTTYLLDGVDMIYFEGLNEDGTGDDISVPFHFRCDGGAWQDCAGVLQTENLGDCNQLELFVGELPAEKYTVTYLWKEESKTVTVSDGERLEEWTPPVPVGERFLGWYLGETLFDFNEAIRCDTTLTASFAKALVPLTYYVDGIEWATETHEYGTEIELKTPSDKIGYRFGGWENSAGEVENSVTLTEPLFLYAVWIKTYVVSFYVDDDLFAGVTVDEGEDASEIPAPEREGCEFIGWYDGDTKCDFPFAVYEDVTLSARFQKLGFHLEFYHDGAVYFRTDCLYHDNLEFPKAPDVTGKRFVGWRYENGDFALETDLVTSNLKLTAVYEAVQVKIRFLAGLDFAWETEAVYGEPCVLPDAPEITGRRFLYWSAEEGGEAYAFGDTWEEETDRAFHAVYATCNYTVTYLFEGAQVDGPTAGAYGDEITFSVLPGRGLRVAKLELYRGGAWEELTDCTFLMPAEDVQVRVTTESYSYSLDVIVDGVIYRVECNEAFTPPTPVRENQIFLGWYTDADFTNAYTGRVTGEEGEQIYLYAKFETVKFTVTFRAGEQEETATWEYGKTPAPSFSPWQDDPTKRFLKWSPSVAVATENAEYVAVYESLYTKIYLDEGVEVFRETVALTESNAPVLARDGYLFEGYELIRQESDALYYSARFSEIPKEEEPVADKNPPTNVSTSDTPSTPNLTQAKRSAQSTTHTVLILLTVVSVGSWVVYLVVLIRRKKRKY